MWTVVEFVLGKNGEWQRIATRYYASRLLAERNWLRLQREDGSRFYMVVGEKAAA